MAYPPSNIDQRRVRVAQLNLRGLSSREISQALANGDKNGEGKLHNPVTGEPYDHKTILADLKLLRGEWSQSAQAAIDEHVGRQFAELQEIKRAAWAGKDPELALKALDKEMKLLGTAKDKDGINISVHLDVIYQIIEIGESMGYTASELFEGYLRKLQSATAK